MKTINLSVELSNIAMETLYQPRTPKQTISKVRNFLGNQMDVMGDYIGTQKSQKRNLGEALTLNEYQLNYEKKSLQFEFIHFKPRGDWQVKGFRFV